ncbi:hypothetical protein HMPREF1210_01129 [Paenisporosarcina sp. HGH0030]|uniref:DUF2634 domain-containing protein n=1 Tax=Paenisporosarcina sp. HGH0030 TaxID=1078085 RepID=UPI00034E6988|nr:DUF2634 domain-containing protein [Paenisporosarcina sp. HGH0030]EPD52749.1 hypothetical protein HMPREF1210_01129 [Paenisporosarcina sp. HGH0030]
MVLPLGEFSINEEVEVLDESSLPTRTYKIDLIKGRITGFIDGRQAIEQSILVSLSTDRFAHLIYSEDFGFENMIGRERLFVAGELPRRIKETVLQDERITDIENFVLEFDGDNATVSFTAITIYGDVEVLKGGITIV